MVEKNSQMVIREYLPSVNKNYVWGAIAIIGIAVGIYLWGKKNATVEQYPITSEDDPKAKPLTEVEKNTAIKLANDIHSAIGSSWNFIIGWDLTSLQTLSSTSDRIFIAVYNLYNSTYLTAPDTLYTELKSEWAWTPPTLLPFNNAEGPRQIFNSLFDRFSRLGMK